MHIHVIPRCLIILYVFLYTTLCAAMDVPVYDFPISAYSQAAQDYFPTDAATYTTPLLSADYQKQQLHQFYTHFYASDASGLSPWSERMVISALPIMKKMESDILMSFSNQNKPPEAIHYAENFKAHDEAWWTKIKENMNLDALSMCEFNPENRAIAVKNTLARALPEHAPDFFHAGLPGQGFPFDNLQESSIWAGTPLYVFSVSKDKAWSLVLTPDGYFAWVKSDDIGYVSSAFVQKWQAAARQKLIAVTQTEASILDNQQHFQFSGYIGAVFPLVERNSDQTLIYIPVKVHQQAVIKIGVISSSASQPMPLVATPKNLVHLISQLKNRPYGWGGAYFFNDCSQEMKSLFTPFGIWLPRNSGQQAQLNTTLDLSKNTMDERLRGLKENGRPLLTLIYIGGHVMLYLGEHTVNGQPMPMTYQNIWGLSPESRDKRYVIGQSLFFPLLSSYPEQPDATSLANKSYFKLIPLDKLNVKPDSPSGFASQFLEKSSPQTP